MLLVSLVSLVQRPDLLGSVNVASEPTGAKVGQARNISVQKRNTIPDCIKFSGVARYIQVIQGSRDVQSPSKSHLVGESFGKCLNSVSQAFGYFSVTMKNADSADEW